MSFTSAVKGFFWLVIMALFIKLLKTLRKEEIMSLTYNYLKYLKILLKF